MRISSLRVFVDGAEVESVDQSALDNYWYGDERGFPCKIAPQLPGEHDVKLVGSLELACGLPGPITSTPFSLSNQVEVEDEPISAFCVADDSPQFAKALLTGMCAHVQIDGSEPHTGGNAVIWCQRLPISVAYDVWMRAEGETEYEKLGTIAARNDRDQVFGFGRSAWKKGRANCRHFDLYLVPNANLAFESGFDRYCNQEVYWHGITPSKGTPNMIDWNPRPGVDVNPTKIGPRTSTTAPATQPRPD